MNYLDAAWQVFLLLVLGGITWGIIKLFKKKPIN